VRTNKEGKLTSLVYGRPAAVALDPIEKKPLFHFLPGTTTFSIGTAGCNLACKFCQNWELAHGPRLGLQIPSENLPPAKAVQRAKDLGARSIAFTYTEPFVFFDYALDCCKKAKAAGLKTVFVSNGYATKSAWSEISEWLDAVNIDLKGSDKFYRTLCAGRLKPVLESIKTAYELGIWLEITTLIIPGKNDSKFEIKKISKFISKIDEEIPWHVTAFHPAFKMTEIPRTPISSLLSAREIGKEAGLKYIYTGNIPSKFESTFCPSCGKLLIERSGFLVLQNHLTDARCSCGKTIKGVWS